MYSMEVTRLIERCRQGDADALGELYKAYAQRMRGVCRRYVSSEQEVDDVLHDAFVIIFTSFDRLRDDQKAESWMTSITRNVASKYKERLKSRSFVPLEEAELMAAHDEESTVKGVPLDEVLQLIDKLPAGYGKVFRLSVFEGLSHKEIAAMLGIEPHSSSSQLARAKKILRKMMVQHWAAVLLLLLMPLTFFLLRKGGTIVKEEKSIVERKKEVTKEPRKEVPAEQPQLSVMVHVPVHHTVVPDSSEMMIAQEQSAPDTIQNDTAHIREKSILPHYDIAHLKLDRPRPHATQRWSIELAYTGGMGEQNVNRPYSFTETPTLVISGEPPSPVTFENWSDYAAFLAENPDDGSSRIRSIIMSIALNNASNAAGTGSDKIVRTSHHYMPVHFSLALKYKLNNRFGLEAGVSYSRLKSEFQMGSNGNTINEQQIIHYLGIPVKGIYNVYNRNVWSLYGSLGVTTEIPVYSQFNTSYYLNGVLATTDKTTIRAPWQWSVGAGLGLQYNITPNIGFFAEPNLQYYIPTRGTIETYRTEHPFTFSLPLGIRFTW